jgi:hypothetical protein
MTFYLEMFHASTRASSLVGTVRIATLTSDCHMENIYDSPDPLESVLWAILAVTAIRVATANMLLCVCRKN